MISFILEKEFELFEVTFDNRFLQILDEKRALRL